MVGKFVPPLPVQRFREARKTLKDSKYDPVDRPFQYVGKPILTVCHQYPLEPFEDINFEELTQQN